ncbi:hypothetical protein HMPREF1398_01151 [Helicobacter pylori GAM117Ai]|uniref:hypothetical protein n=1 Tax=Helicobacter pylori TaxID=210 RepID=UPI00038FA22F|nr:hypothetical protein [Helicobacter pylori]ERA56935.1 hypothetical protein HMPREF1398_01151 [Helicobacter pylori GAM117Ai]
MRQINETAASFKELQAITQAIMLKKSAPTNATNQESERTQASANAKAHTPERTQQTRAQTSENANASDLTQETGLNPKSSNQAKKGRLNPTKKAFSERQITAFRDNSQAGANSRRKTKTSHNANAFKTEQANSSNLRAEPSNKAFKPGLATHQSNQKGGSDEA